MKKPLFTSKIKTILVAAVALAILTTVAVAVSGGTAPGQNVVGTLLSPLRAGVAAIDRAALRVYDYIFSYESLQAEKNALEQEILAMQEDVRTAQEYQRENQRLKQLLKLSDAHEDYAFASPGTPPPGAAPSPSPRVKTRGSPWACAPSPRTARWWGFSPRWAATGPR